METNDEIFISNLSVTGDFENQVQQLLQYVRLTRDQVEGLQRLFDDLQETLHFEWPGCRVLAFGSIVTGLGIKSSDVDCYVKLPRWFSPSEEAFVKTARNILRRRSQIFQNLVAIVNAKVPIVKFYHVPTRRNCDVSFTSPGGVENSKMLAYLLQIDKRILPLTIIIKYWSKVHNLTGTNLMANYALTLLVIFYLQQTHILPPVQCIQLNQQELIIGNWNMAFNAVPHINDNKESLFHLLAGFFKYYARFQYDKFIISPYLGQTIEKRLFADIETVPEDFSLYKTNVSSKISAPLRIDSLICIQDPFEHNRNCSVAVHPKLYNAIIMNFDRAARAADDDINFLRIVLTRTDISWSPGKNKQPSQRAAPRPLSRGITKHNNNRDYNHLRQNIKNHLSHNIRFNRRLKRKWTSQMGH